MKSFAEALSTPEMGKLIAASLERDEKRSEEALRWLLGDEEYERMRRSVEADQILDRVSSTPTKVRIMSSSGGNAEISVGETKLRYITSASIQLMPRSPAIVHLIMAVPHGQLDLDVMTEAGCVLVSPDPKISG